MLLTAVADTNRATLRWTLGWSDRLKIGLHWSGGTARTKRRRTCKLLRIRTGKPVE
jgi:hypothetical protein